MVENLNAMATYKENKNSCESYYSEITTYWISSQYICMHTNTGVYTHTEKSSEENK